MSLFFCITRQTYFPIYRNRRYDIKIVDRGWWEFFTHHLEKIELIIHFFPVIAYDNEHAKMTIFWNKCQKKYILIIESINR